MWIIGPVDGLHWRWTRRVLYIFNGSKHVIHVSLGDGSSGHAVDTGKTSVNQIAVETRLVMLSYYTDTHDLMSILLRDNGSWTTIFTPMVPPRCYTNDRWDDVLGMDLIRRKVCRSLCANNED